MGKLFRNKNKLVLKMLLIQITVFAIISIVSFSNPYWIHVEDINDIKLVSSVQVPLMRDANCSTEWRKQHQIEIDNHTFFNLLHPLLYKYAWNKTPKGTFTYWLSHIYFKNRVTDKAYFADKYLMKQYIYDYKQEYPQFSFLNSAQIIYDLSPTGTLRRASNLSLRRLQQQYGGFLVKPNHFSGKQIIVAATDSISEMLIENITRETRWWFNHKYRIKSNKVNREPWYSLIEPHIFIEEKLNNLTEYKIHVFNYHALFLYNYEKGVSNAFNVYVLPQFILSNVTWARVAVSLSDDKRLKRLSKKNVKGMVEFAEHFARREQIKYVRVDLYVVGDKVYFSEFTFAPISGTAVILPLSFDYLLYDILCDDSHYHDIYDYIL